MKSGLRENIKFNAWNENELIKNQNRNNAPVRSKSNAPKIRSNFSFQNRNRFSNDFGGYKTLHGNYHTDIDKKNNFGQSHPYKNDHLKQKHHALEEKSNICGKANCYKAKSITRREQNDDLIHLQDKNKKIVTQNKSGKEVQPNYSMKRRENFKNESIEEKNSKQQLKIDDKKTRERPIDSIKEKLNVVLAKGFSSFNFYFIF